jgi:tetratricopeptide (TPR) repeat protein
MKVKIYIMIPLALAWNLTAAIPAHGQAPSSTSPSPAQSKPSNQQNPPPAPAKPSADPNAFPDDTKSVPVLPAGSAPAAASDAGGSDPNLIPSQDADPVRSPEEPAANSSSSDADGSSSSLSGLDRLTPPPDAEDRAKRNGKGGKQAPEHQETVAEDVNVGTYYLSTKNWKAALSRFESGMILDPENPDVYWGMAEAQHHLGNFTAAKANYLKLLDYDPDGKHGKEARKALKEPELANAPTASAARPSASPQ